MTPNATLDTIDWETLTRSRAQILRRVARLRERSTGAAFERGEVTEAEFLAAVELEEKLTVFIECGLRPSGLTAVC